MLELEELKIENIEEEKVEILVTRALSRTSVPAVRYAGQNELEAFRKYRQIRTGYKRIIKAKVKRALVNGHEFIMEWEELESIR